ncbi:ATP-dependent Clp protease ATP-binding subunit [Caproiciproducens galactitolivorans]|uniref:ATP-dependent Clp protease ATP-binding subunit ClpE n=1 Tax=Caproiciproducens galactitolivorans TaxID=642589 RepID=A0A4Z0XZE1_9FIRM|nr:ATP-dependent Clp protease ATP-binding subunit [Caproiciproducens galactitolivorans]QEY34833.1 ATP-dependent Clp protease ATP-binding subunit [Caproiciproducens galactitolivorans]TGJ75917.1 ATP-dependent Clp protease ATP-binding subunit ClpE [Caproiciproducens galactitolivorans]
MMCSRCHKRPAVVFISPTVNSRESQGLCLVCAKELGIKPVNDLMEKMGITEEQMEAMESELNELMASNPNDEDDGSSDGFIPGGAATFPFLQNIFSTGGNTPEKVQDNETEKREKKDKRKTKRKHLTAYCTNLTAKAKAGEIDNIIGREKEISRVIQILSRRTKNNPCLIGEPGVGKTAVAEGLALRIANGMVPARLMKKEIHLLDLTALVAGTQFRGQFESRIKGLVDEVKAEGNIILFIDEVHNLVGTGDAEGSMNAANILKPALSRGEIQVIGATTFVEYRKYIEKDAALERRFQPVTIAEPSIEETVDVLMGIKSYYEAYHRVHVSEQIARKAVILSERYINDRFLPDKAIDLLDESCACAALRNISMADYDAANFELEKLREEEEELTAEDVQPDYEKLAVIRTDISRLEEKTKELAPKALGAEVEERDIARVIELWTGIPASKIQENELKKLSDLEDVLNSKVIGQQEAVKAVAAAIRRSRVQISPRRRPASFIFVGPTGIGKTELVKVLSKELFDTPETLIRLDMSEFMEKHSVSRIIGSPPGYVGYDEAGQVTEKVRRRPYSVLLFDEIEKAHPDVMNILLQILDEGHITDAHGRSVNFENTVIVMTSNAGSEKKEGTLGFTKNESDVTREKALKALSEFLRPEFLSRVDEIIVFRTLDVNDYEKISHLMLDEYVDSLKERGIRLVYDDRATRWLAEHAFGKKSGARDLRNLIRREVEDRIASLIVENYADAITGISVTVDDSNAIRLDVLK